MSWLAPALMIASGSIHAVVNAILKSGRDRMAGRALIDASSAVLMLPTLAFVALPSGAWSWLALSAVVHAVYIYALVRAFHAADFSAAYPILRGVAPTLTAVLAVGVLGEAASAGSWWGSRWSRARCCCWWRGGTSGGRASAGRC